MFDQISKINTTKDRLNVKKKNEYCQSFKYITISKSDHFTATDIVHISAYPNCIRSQASIFFKTLDLFVPRL